MAGRLVGKVALITGTAGGQGRAAATAFAAEGASVVGCDLKVAENKETVQLVESVGGRMTAMAPVDLSDPAAAKAWIDEAAGCYGGVDVLYNNASATRFAPLPQLSIEDWTFGIRNELDIVFYAVKYVWPHLKIRGGGVILNTASIAGMVGTLTPGASHAAAKGGVIALTRQIAAEGAADGIRASCISPGPVDSPGTAEMFSIPDIRRRIEAATIVGRVGKPEEVAKLAVFLASDEASFITGANFAIDGGQSAL